MGYPDLRVLIVGAGIGGMTLAALLERRGLCPTVIDRAPSTSHAGYMLGLWPLGSRVLHGLGLYDAFRARSVECVAYEARDGSGGELARWSMAPIAERLGPLLSSTRPDLVEVLRSGLGDVDVRFRESVAALEPAGDTVRVRFDTGAEETFDLVVGADGIGSEVRRLVAGEQPRHDTGWGGWVWWAPDGTVPEGTFVEYWGTGRILGAYPTRRGVGVFAGAPADGGFASAGPGRQDRLRERFAGLGEAVDRMLDAVPADGEELFFWRLVDVRSRAWRFGRVVLLGDAAAGFLPTAGVGASMAMESAAALADELSRADRSLVPHALALYERRRRARVEAIQAESRRLARLMLVSSPPLAAARNLATRFLPLDAMVSSIFRAWDEPI